MEKNDSKDIASPKEPIATEASADSLGGYELSDSFSSDGEEIMKCYASIVRKGILSTLKEKCLKYFPAWLRSLGDSRITPLLLSFIVGVIFFVSSYQFSSSNIQSLFINIASSFFAILLIFFAYDKIKERIERKRFFPIFEYAREQIDSEMFRILTQIYKTVISYEDSRRVHITHEFQILYITKDSICKKLKESKYIGFQVLKSWDIHKKRLKSILSNSFLLQRLSNEQVKAIVQVLQAIAKLDDFYYSKQTYEKLYISEDKDVSNAYKLEKIESSNKTTAQYTLLHNIGIKNDIGTFPIETEDELLTVFHINERFVDIYALYLLDTLNAIKHWKKVAGGDFMLMELSVLRDRD
jgi:hypothetical protein